jgi:hypothetical protein
MWTVFPLIVVCMIWSGLKDWYNFNAQQNYWRELRERDEAERKKRTKSSD